MDLFCRITGPAAGRPQLLAINTTDGPNGIRSRGAGAFHRRMALSGGGGGLDKRSRRGGGGDADDSSGSVIERVLGEGEEEGSGFSGSSVDGGGRGRIKAARAGDAGGTRSRSVVQITQRHPGGRSELRTRNHPGPVRFSLSATKARAAAGRAGDDGGGEDKKYSCVSPVPVRPA
ncbi:hypothetical protein EX30DRAFT_364734 [Ascodesmis nigricans]|uniref:Uncharacterized protein n=1 Tax=Ascodesmis nigricans TaxID=341454 RepID=A0A4S2MUP0_9PEZI|nr:hypothetical protein EX30DRAFT_364734 [Ascodesmis nigricans]